MYSCSNLSKEWTSIGKWRTVLHLGQLRAILELGSIGTLSHLSKDWAGILLGTSWLFLRSDISSLQISGNENCKCMSNHNQCVSE